MAQNKATFVSHKDAVFVTLRSGYARNVKKATVFLHGQTIKKLRGNRSGRTYFVPGTRKKYQASAPGEAPASATGMLRSFNGVDFDLLDVGTDRVRGRVGSKLAYGRYLEQGTKKMAPRPYLKPAFDENATAIQDILSEAIE